MPLKAYIENSSLSQKDKNLWLLLVEKLDDDRVKILEDFIEGKEENLKLLNENFKAKTEALKNLDRKALEDIIKKEK